MSYLDVRIGESDGEKGGVVAGLDGGNRDAGVHDGVEAHRGQTVGGESLRGSQLHHSKKFCKI